MDAVEVSTGVRKRRGGDAAAAAHAPARAPAAVSRASVACVRPVLREPTLWLTRVVFFRLLGFIYLMAWLSFVHQFRGLLGAHGLLPVKAYMEKVDRSTSDDWARFKACPSVLWWTGNDDATMLAIGYVGIFLAVLMMLDRVNMLVVAVQCALYQSIVVVGQAWYGFGWEIMMMESTFTAIFLPPLLRTGALPRGVPASRVVAWLQRYYMFRIMLGAGLIKVRGDTCWRDLTCMDYFYETSPIPSPMTWWMHQSPPAFHALEVWVNHFVELVAPWFLLFPHPLVASIAGAGQIFFQTILIISGNLSFLNWLTITPALWCIDDTWWQYLFTTRMVRRVAALQADDEAPAPPPTPTPTLPSVCPQPLQLVPRTRRTRRRVRPARVVRTAVVLAVACLVLYLSRAPLENMVRRRQAMNTSFDFLRLVNTYGAFGSVGKVRPELIIEGTRDATVTPASEWRVYEFKCKPTDPTRRPCSAAPYHYRLDWLIWFTAMYRESYQRHPWLIHLLVKLLHNDRAVLSLLGSDPFPDARPAWIRVRYERYTFTTYAEWRAGEQAWYHTQPHDGGVYLPPVSLTTPSIAKFCAHYGWDVHAPPVQLAGTATATLPAPGPA